MMGTVEGDGVVGRPQPPAGGAEREDDRSGRHVLTFLFLKNCSSAAPAVKLN